jgi:hypothetical protein
VRRPERGEGGRYSDLGESILGRAALTQECDMTSGACSPTWKRPVSMKSRRRWDLRSEEPGDTGCRNGCRALTDCERGRSHYCAYCAENKQKGRAHKNGEHYSVLGER